MKGDILEDPEARRNFLRALWGKSPDGGPAKGRVCMLELLCGTVNLRYIASFVFLLVPRKSKSFWDSIIIKKDLKEMIFERQTLLRSGWHSDTKPYAMSSASCPMP